MWSFRVSRGVRAAVSGVVLVVAVVAILVDGSPSSAIEDPDASRHINQCEGTGTVGVYSSHSNEQACYIGFYVCVGPDTQTYPPFDGLPAGAVGVIMIPWGDPWHETNGNNGYVGNVCNGTAGIANVITYASPLLWDSAPITSNPSFASHLAVMQQQCSGRCSAELASYHIGLQLWSDNTLHIREQGLQSTNWDHHSLAYRLVSFYLASGPIYWDGYTVNSYGQGFALGAGGYGSVMSQTVLAEGDTNEWEEFKDGMAKKALEFGLDAGSKTLEIAIGVIEILFEL